MSHLSPGAIALNATAPADGDPLGVEPGVDTRGVARPAAVRGEAAPHAGRGEGERAAPSLWRI